MEVDNVMAKNISYLRARDPSILSFNRPKLSQVRTNLIEEFCEKTQASEKTGDENENIRVYLRIKNGRDFADSYEIDGNTLISKLPPTRGVKECDTVRKMYTFSKIFLPETTQRELFNNIVKPKILDFINGQNSTLLTYGVSGSGKTFTVIGTDDEPGLVPRSLEYLFRTLPHLTKNPRAKPLPSGKVTFLNDVDCKKEKSLCKSLLNASSSSLERTQHIKTYMAMQQRLSEEPVAQLEDHSGVSVGVWVSFAEIYNEQIYDLLQLDPPRGTQRPKLRLGAANGHVYIKNLTSVSVTTGQEAYQILQYGLHNLNYAPTQLNKHSSRSHSIFTVKLVQVSQIDGGSYVSCFNFCDLAGSERTKKTQNVGDRLKESNNINSSLLVLGRCISAVRNLQKENKDQKCLPFRESQLTHLFQKALMGQEDIAMIVNVSLSRETFDESQHVLNFSAVAKDITIERRPDPAKKKNRFSQLVEGREEVFCDFSEADYKNIIERLQDEMEQQRIDLETTHKMNLDYVRQGYDQLVDRMMQQEKESIERAKKRIEAQYEAKLAIMKLDYEKLLREATEKNKVIEITSSEESGEEEEEDAEEEEEKKICKNCRPEITYLKETLEEAVESYKELQYKYDKLEIENLKLKERIQELEKEVDIYREETFLLKSDLREGDEL